ncbi:LuxR C-terminal-related transcriptional regulator [Micromonospora andamanensis]|uniref:LuxR C-terminal-related transcriptional regulator n=1 Tax=Micromonospora andamanensis TaxID=1287068 RepID=UPI00194FF8C1|nr:LuxR C-terminal-related transcriptional regulator [Micromonospora andamanensis]GIJ42253.1 helix-turn-helix transcriptional regulator [Micromonospora andamanensis]
MMTSAVADSPLVLDAEPTDLLDAITADPAAPLALGVTGPDGHGRTTYLQELAGRYARAGVTTRTEVPATDDACDPDAVLLIDDAHLLDDDRLRTLRRLVADRRHRIAVSYRPWPRPAALVELTDTLRREGRQLLLTPFTRARTAAYLAAVPRLGRRPELVDFVHTQTGGVPRHVGWLVDGLREHETAGVPTEPPRQALLHLGPDLEHLASDVRRLLIALAAGVPLPTEALRPLLNREPAGIDDLVAEARAAGLLSADGRPTPLVGRAVTALSPAADRTAVWHLLSELALSRGAPVLPLVRSLLAAGVAGDCPAATLEAAAEEALGGEPALAAELFAAAGAAGRPTGGRQAVAAALAGDLDLALRLADRLLTTATPAGRAEAALVAATALAHRGQTDRSVELYRWSGGASAHAFAVVGALATGRPSDHPEPTQDSPPTLPAGAARLMAAGVRESVHGTPSAALSTLVQAAALLEPDGRAVLLPDSPAALAALTAVHCGELDIAERVLDRALASGIGGPLLTGRHRLLRAWILMARGRIAAAGEQLAQATAGVGLESRDLLFAAGLTMGIARRASDLGALQRGWVPALEAVVRHPVDLFTLLPLGELAIAGARLGDLDRLQPYLRAAHELLGRLADPPLWRTPLHWSGLHAAILTDDPAAADQHVSALVAAAGHSRYAAVVAAAAECWLEVLRGTVDAVRVEAAARGLHDTGLCWDGARLAGQAAIRTADRRAMTALLDCARALQGRSAAEDRKPAAGAVSHRLSDREREVAELVVAGLTYREIGDRLFISAKTVEHHVARMRSRLNCANRTDLLALLRTILADPSYTTNGQPWPRRAAN